MKLLSFLTGGQARWGAATVDGIVDLGRRLPAFGSVLALLEGGEAAMAQA
ncbi:2-hydroxyhepta-2,4-diene-1,7-dioate isomerase, partial [Acidovorax cattleyae]|nr:2-hydroxyhepta-2,4-diene-1,7-dioate isomerase [Paracidovorax cattleyae]